MSNTNSTATAEKTPLQNVETVAGYNHPTGTIAGHYCQRAQAENENKSKYAAMSKTAPLAAVMLKCFECSGYSVPESRGCNCRDCALWVLRHHRAARKQETATAGEE